MCQCENPKRAISGVVALENGLVFNWLRFVDAAPIEEAKANAIAIVTAQHKDTVARCWCD